VSDLVRDHQASVWRYLRYLGCEATLADDLTQETFLAVLRTPFEHRSNPETASYLRTVARRQFLMAMRKRRNTPSLEDLESAEEVWRDQIEKGNDKLDALDECVGHLQGRPQQAIDMHYRQGHSRKNIAEALGMSIEGVKTLLRRTRDRLRDCISRRVKRES